MDNDSDKCVPQTDAAAKSDSPWLLRDAVTATLIVVAWRISPHLFPATLASLPDWAKGAFLLLGPQLFYVLVPIGLIWLRGVRGGFQVPTRRQFVTEAAVALGILAAMIVVFAAMFLVLKVLIPDFSFVPPTYRRRAAAVSMQALWIILAFSITVAPVCEETFFRGFLHRSLRSQMPTPVAGVIQSLLFALMHTLDPILTPASFVVGIALTAMYEWRKSLLSPVFMHAGLNAASAGVFLLVVMTSSPSPMLGIAGEDHPNGCRITKVIQHSPAATASLKPGDVINSVDGEAVTGFADLIEVVQSREVGEQITLRILRDGVATEVDVVLDSASRPAR